MDSSAGKIDLSVIIPTYNRSRLLDYTLRSLVLQNIPVRNFEVVIGDDGSSDDTAELVNSYKDRLNVKYVLQEDRGYRPASARNKAIRIAEGSLCLFIDSVILLNTDVLGKHIQFHREAGPSVAAVGYVYGFDREGEAETRLKKLISPDDPAGSIREIAQHEVYFDLREGHYKRHNDQIDRLPAPWIYFWMGHISVMREDLLRVGLFDESYDGRWGVEDNDLGFRLHQGGVSIRLLRSAHCVHYPHNTHKPEKEEQGRENCRYFNDKFGTAETDLFLKYYGQDDVVDINVLSMQLSNRIH